jgi:hypothetical protein
MPCLNGWLMRETGGFVAAGLPVSAGGSMPRTSRCLWVGRPGASAGGRAAARELSRFRATPWTHIATVRVKSGGELGRANEEAAGWQSHTRRARGRGSCA